MTNQSKCVQITWQVFSETAWSSKGNHVKQQPPSSPTAALKQAMLEPLSANESPQLVMQAMLGVMLSDLHDAERLTFFKYNSHIHVMTA